MKTWTLALCALPGIALGRLERRAIDVHAARRHVHLEARQITDETSTSPTLDCASFQSRAAPANIAPGSLTPAQGCSRYYNATASSYCMNIIENSGSGLSVDQFTQLNPSVGGKCWGVWADSAYCVAVTQCAADGSRSAAEGCTRFAQVTPDVRSPDAFAEAQNLTFAHFQGLNPNVTRSTELDLHTFYCVSNAQVTFVGATGAAESSLPTANQFVAALATPASASSSDADIVESTPSSSESEVSSTPSPEPVESTSSSWESEQPWTPSPSSSEEEPWSSENEQWTSEETSTSTTPAWTPTSTPTSEWVAPPSTEVKKVAAYTPAVKAVGGAAMGQGQATFFAPGLGSCGGHNTASDFIFAASATLYDMVGGNALCGASVTVTRASDGKTVTGTIVDKCPSGECTPCSLDMSPAAFNAIASPSEGRVAITWNVNSLPFADPVLAAVAAACNAQYN